MTAHRCPPALSLSRTTIPDDQAIDGESLSLRWFTAEEAAELCRRSPSTIRGLISKHQLRRKTAWRTVRRRPPVSVKWLQKLTLFREAPPT